MPALPSPRARISNAPGCPFPRPSGASPAVARHTLYASIAVCRGELTRCPSTRHHTTTPQTIPALPVLPSQRKLLEWLNCNDYRYASTLLRCAQRDREPIDEASGTADLVTTPLGPASYLDFTWSGSSVERALFMDPKSSLRTPTYPRRPFNPPGRTSVRTSHRQVGRGSQAYLSRARRDRHVARATSSVSEDNLYLPSHLNLTKTETGKIVVPLECAYLSHKRWWTRVRKR